MRREHSLMKSKSLEYIEKLRNLIKYDQIVCMTDVVFEVLIIINIPSMQEDWIPTKLADTEDNKGSYTTTITKEGFHSPVIGDDDDAATVENTTVKTKQV